MAFTRYVALGDSFSEGVGDPDPSRPNGLRGWADRVAEQLAGHDPEFTYANLAIRGRKLSGVLDEQIDPAIAMSPDLVTIYAGGNDILRPKVNIDALVAAYDAGLSRLAATGAHLVVWTAHDPSASKLFAALRGRFAIYNELVREMAASHDATLVDFWRLHDYRDWRYWGEDRLHMNSAGHQRMAIAVLDELGVQHSIAMPELVETPRLSRSQEARKQWQWARHEAGPWVHRRITGRSSGDTVSPRRPNPAPVE